MSVGLTREFKEKWLTALTDGSYKRTRREMVSSDDKKRCCLGVARALLGTQGKSDVYLDDAELEVLGLADVKASDGSRNIQYELAVLNDDNDVPEGMYYPQEVIDAIKALPVRGLVLSSGGKF